MIEFDLTEEQIEKIQPLLKELKNAEGLIFAQINHVGRYAISAKFIDLTTAVKIINILKQDGYYD
jgi:2,4-dienoyl-CoA reductase-like NADH-dependent reductase (Old Yellow Enzyme family)